MPLPPFNILTLFFTTSRWLHRIWDRPGIKGIYLGPTLPAFLSPNVLQYLVDTFDLRLITNAEDDIKTCLKQNI